MADNQKRAANEFSSLFFEAKRTSLSQKTQKIQKEFEMRKLQVKGSDRKRRPKYQEEDWYPKSLAKKIGLG